MARCLWMLALCFTLAAPAAGQAPGDEESSPRERRGRTGAEEPGDEPRRGGLGSGNERGERDERGGRDDARGRDEGGGRGGYFRRSNPMFEALDADGDEVISVAELKKAVVALKKLDVDGDGKITLAEAAPQGGPGGAGGPGGLFGDPDAMAEGIFDENDKNGDGKLSEDEVPERLAPMLRGADQDGDGAISKAELNGAMEQMRNRFRGDGGPGGGFGGGFGGGNPQQFVQRFAQYDRDGNGKLTSDEVPAQMQGMLQGGDQDGDGAINTQELQQIAERMSQRFGRGGERGFGERGGDRDNPRSRGGDDRDGAEGEDDDEDSSRGRRPSNDE